MTTEKMASTYICCIAAVILVLIAKETSNYNLEEAMIGLVQKGTKKYSLSPLYCINECLRRACCTAVGYSPAKGLKPYSCLFKCHNSTQMTDPGMCESRLVLKHKIPTVRLFKITIIT